MAESRGRNRRFRELRRLLPDVQPTQPGTYERDQGIFSLAPAAVIRPTEEEQIASALRAASQMGIPLVARAGGSNTGGAAITTGILMLFDQQPFSRMTLDEEHGRLCCGAAVRHDRVQEAFGRTGFHLPSDPSSGPLSRLAGNINTRASGPHALRHGAINRYVREVRFITADGTVIDTRRPAQVPRRLIDELRALAGTIAADDRVRARLEARRDVKWASGYELLALLDHADDPVRALPRLLTGSVGTLGIVTEAELQGLPREEGRAAVLLRFEGDGEACAAALDLRSEAQAVELVSCTTLELLHERMPALRGASAGTLLIVEYAGAEATTKARHAADRLSTARGLRSHEIATDEQSIAAIWKERKALLPLVRSLTGIVGVPYSVVNDVGVDPPRLPELLEGAERVLARHGLRSAVYGHAGSGNLHLRPFFAPGDEKTVRAVAEEIYTLVGTLGGTVTAEHGMGRLRSPFLELEWGAQIVGLMRNLKHIFDPDDVLNPDTLFVPRGHRFSTSGWPTPPSLSGSG